MKPLLTLLLLAFIAAGLIAIEAVNTMRYRAEVPPVELAKPKQKKVEARSFCDDHPGECVWDISQGR